VCSSSKQTESAKKHDSDCIAHFRFCARSAACTVLEATTAAYRLDDPMKIMKRLSWVLVVCILHFSLLHGATAELSKDYYKTLGVKKSATTAEIRKQYKTLAKKWHPDKVQGDEKTKLAAQEKFMAINEAHEILSDTESRREYDESKDDRNWRPKHSNFHAYRNQQFQNWQRAQQHWQYHHQYTQSPPSLIRSPMLLFLIVPVALLIFSSIRGGGNSEETPSSTQSSSGSTQSTPAARKKQPAPPLSALQKQHLQLAPDLIQVCCLHVVCRVSKEHGPSNRHDTPTLFASFADRDGELGSEGY